MSKEKMEFILPGVFTVGPEDNDNSLRKYATLLNDGVNLQELVKGIVEGETRIVAASMDIEEIFNGRESFRKNIINTVQVELAKFGLLIYNANIKEMEDSVGSEYFGVVRQKKKAEAENTARRDIADAKYQGDIGVKEKERDTRVQVSQFEADSILAENSNQIEMSKSISLMEVQKADFDRQAKIAQIEAQKASEIRNIELQRELDQKKIAQETERLRSIYMSQAIVDAEAKERSADATLYAAQKEAEAIRAKFDAQAEGLRNLLSCTPDTNTILLYTMIEKGTMKDLAEQNAKAINGLNPRIWITGDTGNTNPIGDIMKTLPPLMSTLYEQTGIKPPGWVVDMKKFDKLTK
jgi:flotillin